METPKTEMVAHEVLLPFTRHFSPVYTELKRFMKKNGNKPLTTTEAANALNKNKTSIRRAMRQMFAEGLIVFHSAERKEQKFAPTDKLLEDDHAELP